MKEKRYQPNISPELFQQWKESRRPGDVKELVELTGVRPPTINKALIYGNVAQQSIVKAITDYFISRLEKEKEAARVLSELRAELS